MATKTTTKATAKKSKLTPVIVTTKHRGVFFGELESYDDDRKTAIIHNVRCAVQWRNIRGFIDLAVNGPGADCRISPAAPKMTVTDYTGIIECSEEASSAWAKGPWRR